MIPHFFVGVYMYSNSSILTPDWIKKSFGEVIKTTNRYLNSQRFQSIHVAIFVALAALLAAILVLRYSLIFAVRRLYTSCKNALQKHKVIGDVSGFVSDNFYGTLNAD